MSFIQRFLLGNRVDDDLQVGLFLKNDGTVWLRNPDGSETQVTGGASPPPASWLTADLEVLSATGTHTYNNVVTAGSDLSISDTDVEIATPGVYQITVFVEFAGDETGAGRILFKILGSITNFDWLVGQDDPCQIVETVIPPNYNVERCYSLPPISVTAPCVFQFQSSLNIDAGAPNSGDGTLIVRRLS